MLVVPVDERRGIAKRAVETAGRNLRVADVTRIGRDATQTDRAGEVNPAVLTRLSARDPHPAKAQFVDHRRAEWPRVADGSIAGACVDAPAEARNQRFQQGACAKRLALIRVEGADSREQLVAAAEAVVDTDTHLRDLLRLFADRGEVLQSRGRC